MASCSYTELPFSLSRDITPMPRTVNLILHVSEQTSCMNSLQETCRAGMQLLPILYGVLSMYLCTSL